MHLRIILVVGFAVLVPNVLFAQGTVIFVNRGGISTTAAPGQTIAPVYSYPREGTARISGNTSTGVPAGNTSYGSTPFLNAGTDGGTWVATLWGINSNSVQGEANNNNLQFLAIASFRANPSSTFNGIWIPPANPVPVPGITSSEDRATFQVRVWDTKGGTVTTWEQAQILANNGCLLLGYSELFAVPFPLGDDSNPAPYLQGMQSFSLIFTPSICIPEPSAVVLGLLGGSILLASCSAKRRAQKVCDEVHDEV